MAIVVIALLALAVVLFERSQSGSDTIDDLGGVVDDSAPTATEQIAQAIATAEGFYVSGSRPQRNNNPGDMTADLVGTSTGKDGAFVIYGNAQDGWNNLYAQVNAWLNGTSKHAGPDSTITDVASFYTTTDQAAWAQTVAGRLGVTVDTPLSAIAGGGPAPVTTASAVDAPVYTDGSYSGDTVSDDSGDNS